MKLHKVLLVFLTLLMVLAAMYSGAGAKPSSDAMVTLAVDQTSFAADQEVTVYVTISNPTGHTIKVLAWYTPMPEVEGPLFAVMRDGAAVAYTGAVYKRPAPTADDYIKLKAGESMTSAVPLSQYYDLTASGVYAVTYDVASSNLSSEKDGPNQQVETLTSNTLELAIEGRPASGPAFEAVAPQAVSGATSFNKCTTSQQSTLLSARSQASTYSMDASSYLNSGKTGSRYTTWFGVVTTTRYNQAKTNFTAISGAMDTKPVTFDCGCKKPYYAYVYPNKPYVIYLCKVFWNAPMTGTDSKAGTLIHEMSHFYVVASTDDYVYGQSGAKNLAITDPNKAVDNADNHEYFAENTPALP
jgi:peptidyl-Lys metalloendopeptidase